MKPTDRAYTNDRRGMQAAVERAAQEMQGMQTIINALVEKAGGQVTLTDAEVTEAAKLYLRIWQEGDTQRVNLTTSKTDPNQLLPVIEAVQ